MPPSVESLPLSVPTVPSGPMVVFWGSVGVWVVLGAVEGRVVGAVVARVVGAAVVARVVGAAVVTWVDAVVVLPLLLRQPANIDAVRTKMSARIVNRFIVILLKFLRFGCSISETHRNRQVIPTKADENGEFSKNLQKVKIDHCHFGVLYVS